MARRTSFLFLFVISAVSTLDSIFQLGVLLQGCVGWSGHLVWCLCIDLGVQTAAKHKVKKLVEEMKNGNYFLLYRNTLPEGLFAFSNSVLWVLLEEIIFHNSQSYTSGWFVLDKSLNESIHQEHSATFKKKVWRELRGRYVIAGVTNILQHAQEQRMIIKLPWGGYRGP